MSGGEGSWYNSNILSDLFPGDRATPRGRGQFVKAENEKRGCFGLRRGCSQVLEVDGGRVTGGENATFFFL